MLRSAHFRSACHPKTEIETCENIPQNEHEQEIENTNDDCHFKIRCVHSLRTNRTHRTTQSNHKYVEQIIIEMGEKKLLDEFHRCYLQNVNWDGDPVHLPMYLFWETSIEKLRHEKENSQNMWNDETATNYNSLVSNEDENGCVRMDSSNDNECIVVKEEYQFIP